MGTDVPAADAVLEDIAASIHTVLGRDLVAIYLFGSYVSGGFDPGVSDLDLVAVTSAEVEELDLPGLQQMHRDLISRHPEWDDRIEVVYVGRATLESFRTSRGRLAVISPGEAFHVRDDPASEWTQNWYLARETGVALHGPPAAVTIPPVDWSEFATAAMRHGGQLAGRNLRDERPGAVAYAVLTMSRAVMTVRTQSQGSKAEGAAWARRAYPGWAWLVDAALECRRSGGTLGFADAETRAAADAFIGLLAAEMRTTCGLAGWRPREVHRVNVARMLGWGQAGAPVAVCAETQSPSEPGSLPA